MIITVIGKRNVSRADKRTGETCIDCVVHFSYKDATVEGLAVRSKWVAAFRCPPEQIIIGKQYEISEHDGFINKFKAIPEEKGDDLPW